MAMQKPVCPMPKKWQHMRPIQAITLVLPGARVRNYVVERQFQRTSRKIVALQMVDIHNLSSDRVIIAWTVEEEEEEIATSKVHCTRRFSSRSCWQAIYYVFTIESASGMIPNLWYLHRRSEEEEQTDLDPEQLTKNKKKRGKCHKLEATRCKNSLRIARR